MENMFKRLLIIALAVLMAVSFVACGKGDNNNDNNNNNNQGNVADDNNNNNNNNNEDNIDYAANGEQVISNFEKMVETLDLATGYKINGTITVYVENNLDSLVYKNAIQPTDAEDEVEPEAMAIVFTIDNAYIYITDANAITAYAELTATITEGENAEVHKAYAYINNGIAYFGNVKTTTAGEEKIAWESTYVEDMLDLPVDMDNGAMAYAEMGNNIFKDYEEDLTNLVKTAVGKAFKLDLAHNRVEISIGADRKDYVNGILTAIETCYNGNKNVLESMDIIVEAATGITNFSDKVFAEAEKVLYDAEGNPNTVAGVVAYVNDVLKANGVDKTIGELVDEIYEKVMAEMEAQEENEPVIVPQNDGAEGEEELSFYEQMMATYGEMTIPEVINMLTDMDEEEYADFVETYPNIIDIVKTLLVGDPEDEDNNGISFTTIAGDMLAIFADADDKITLPRFEQLDFNFAVTMFTNGKLEKVEGEINVELKDLFTFTFDAEFDIEEIADKATLKVPAGELPEPYNYNDDDNYGHNDDYGYNEYGN